MDRHALRRRALQGGAIAGVIGGAVLALFLVVMALAHHQDVWPALKGASAPFFHDRVMRPGFDAGPVLLGVLCHFVVSVGWGLLFGLIAFGFSTTGTIIFGAFFGVLTWIGMAFVVLPAAGVENMAQHMRNSPSALEHVFFGVVMALGFLPYQVPRAFAAFPKVATHYR
jgi:hypothetical protein